MCVCVCLVISTTFAHVCRIFSWICDCGICNSLTDFSHISKILTPQLCVCVSVLCTFGIVDIFIFICIREKGIKHMIPYIVVCWCVCVCHLDEVQSMHNTWDWWRCIQLFVKKKFKQSIISVYNYV